MVDAYCPECNRRLTLDQPELGLAVTCHNCGTQLEVIFLDPLQLDWVEGDGGGHSSPSTALLNERAEP